MLSLETRGAEHRSVAIEHTFASLLLGVTQAAFDVAKYRPEIDACSRTAIAEKHGIDRFQDRMRNDRRCGRRWKQKAYRKRPEAWNISSSRIAPQASQVPSHPNPAAQPRDLARHARAAAQRKYDRQYDACAKNRQMWPGYAGVAAPAGCRIVGKTGVADSCRRQRCGAGRP